MGAPGSLALANDQNVQSVMTLAHLYSLSAEALLDQPFAQIDYKANTRSSTPIPTGFLLEGCTAHYHLDVTLNLNAGAAPALTFLEELAAVQEMFLQYNGVSSTIWDSDSIFARQRAQMEFPNGDIGLAKVVPVPSGVGTNYSLDWYEDVPATYSVATLRGLLNENSNEVHSAIGVTWGDVANCYALSAGQTATATGYVEFLARRQSAPQDPSVDGVPDLTKNYVVTYQDFPINGSKNNRLVLNASDTITRITINMLEGGVGNGGVEAYDSGNALQLSNVKLGWATNITKFDAPYWFWQQEAAKRYGTSFKKWLNAGTVVVDLDQTGGRDWIDAENVTSLALTLDFGAAPPADTKARVTLETLVNSGTVPLR